MRRRGHRDIGVIGAGLSGLTAARHLIDAGHTVTLFDKGRRPGGRANTREHGSRRFDHGAQYFTIHGDAGRAWLAELRAAGVVSEWHGRLVYIDADGESAASVAERYVAVPGMVDLALHLAEGLDVRTGVRIAAARRHEDRWILTDSNRAGHGPFDRIVVAVPAPQAGPLLEAAPDLQARAQAVDMAPCWATMLAFSSRLDVRFDGAFVRDGPLTWIARNSSKPGRPDEEAWVLHFGPEWTRAHWNDDGDGIAMSALAALRDLVGPVPDPEFYRAHRWGYALASGAARDILYDPELGIGACGDWSAGGRVEGAMTSGLEIARRLTDDTFERPLTYIGAEPPA
ncbi:MAG: FAD-dependent oxidoreductase [Gemmatimonadetes bacterium]|nr:FAD-dependent oxidoreductase [Gemmatimonadota bacterium]